MSGRRKRRGGAPKLDVGSTRSLDFDVTPTDLLDGGSQPGLAAIVGEVDRQWPQGRDPSGPSGNGRGTRIGTVYTYFDHEGVLHMHFSARGAYLTRTGGLADVPVGHLPTFFVAPAMNVADSAASQAADLLVTMPADVANDPRWDKITALLRQIQASPAYREAKPTEPSPDAARKHRELTGALSAFADEQGFAENPDRDDLLSWW